MNAPLTAVGTASTLNALMTIMGRQARDAARKLALAPASRKNRALAGMAAALRRARQSILAANSQDVAEADSASVTPAFLDRLQLNAGRIEAMAAGLDAIRKLKDPVGEVTASWRRPNGMRIERVRVPLGVVGMIYESRPNVTADAGALCVKAGNAVILRGGSESFRSTRAIHAALVEGLSKRGFPPAASRWCRPATARPWA
jgi:glutamate-5-semialdehyde dehydrogenase